jgi:hypothetical protein
MKRFPRVYGLVAGLVLTGSLTATTAAFQNGPIDRGQALDDFIFYVLTAKPDMAAGFGRTLLDSGITNAELAELVDAHGLGKRVEEALRRGRRMEGVEDLLADFETRLERGRQDLSRDQKRIDEAISMLVGNLRGQMQAQARLEAAGEYAVPALLRVIVQNRGPDLELAATNMIKRIKRQAVTPLCEALPELDPTTQRKVCDMLGEIGWRHAAPYLLELAQANGTPQAVKEAATRAFNQIGGGEPDLAMQFTVLATRYFSEEEPLIAWPGEPSNNVWIYNQQVGLEPIAVPTAIYSEVMAMRSSRRALTSAPQNAPALALYIAANLKRENELPTGATDPLFGEAQYTPQFFATVAGTTTAQDVLALALDARNTALIRDAIAALSQTTGGANLIQGTQRQPLLECLRFPDRRVQYEAALTLGRALPTQAFSGSDAVVPLLASAVRSGATSYALVIADDAENRRLETTRLQNLGFTVLNGGSNASEAAVEVAGANAVDLIVVRTNPVTARESVNALRVMTKTSVAPMLVVADSADRAVLASEFGGNASILVWQPAGDEAFTAAVDAVMAAGAGGRIGESEADQYAFDALEALHMIAVANSPVFNIADAENSLLAALAERSGGVRMTVADVVARISSARAQVALFDASLAASDREQIELFDHTAASARRFGSKAEQRHIDALMQIVSTASGDLADAAARLHGALNLPASNAVRLIVK